MLKMKQFNDKEFRVVKISRGPFPITIDHKEITIETMTAAVVQLDEEGSFVQQYESLTILKEILFRLDQDGVSKKDRCTLKTQIY
jgi:hypothetical protein